MKYTAFYKRCIALAALISCTCMPLCATAAYEKLQKGDSGEAVFKLEEAMAMQGYFDAMPDQIYDDATVYGVKAFQEKNNLKVDGIAGTETLTLLYGELSGDSEEASDASGLMPSTLRNLSLNKQGNDVSSLQTRLTELGYYTGRISGSYGKLTKSAVQAFQKANGLTADGIAGVRTQTKLYSAQAISAAAASAGTTTGTTTDTTTSTGAAGAAGATGATGVIYETLKAGMNNEGVRQMQQKLKDLGYYSGSVSGNFGNVTWEAVKAFQKASGLKADGIAGQKTLEKLYSTSVPTTGTPDTSTDNTQTDTNTTVDTSTADTTLTLKVGMSSDAVKQMQQKLKDMGYYTGSVTGRFGNLTWEGVRKFQKAKGLTADGIAGPKTLTALYATSTGSTNTNTSTNTSTSTDEVTVNATLRVGDRGTDVKTMQKRLKELGYLSGSADGIFGTGTESAVKAFQTANALYADGVAGPKTLNRLNSSSAVAAAGGSSASSSVGKNDTSTTLRHGMKGMEQIRDMQTRLTELGYYSGSITGNFGDLTLKAVKAFQTANSLSADGIAGKNTLTKLYSSSAIKAGSSSGSTSSSGSSSTTPSGFPKASEVQNVDWYDYIRPYYKAGTVMQIYDFENNLTWQCVMMSNGKHSDSQPRTAEDTEIMYKAFGNKNTWTPKAVWIRMPDGKVFLASMHNMPHLSGSIKNNNFDGHLCIHFPRTMADAEATGPYAVSHQKEIIKGWEKTQKLAGN